MPLGRRRPLLRAAAVGTVAYQGSKRGARAAENEAEAAPVPPQASPSDGAPEDPTVEKLKELAELHASGTLTDDEFASAKAKALGISPAEGS
jgi:hypothetical protein